MRRRVLSLDSGLKSNILGLGAWAWDEQQKRDDEHLPKKQWPVQWLKPVPSMKLLGVEFQAEITKTGQLNWQNQLLKMLGIIRENYDRKMTLYGRVRFEDTLTVDHTKYFKARYERRFRVPKSCTILSSTPDTHSVKSPYQPRGPREVRSPLLTRHTPQKPAPEHLYQHVHEIRRGSPGSHQIGRAHV